MGSTFSNFKCLFFHYESRKTPFWNVQKRIVTLYNVLILTPLQSGLWYFSVWLLPSSVSAVPLFKCGRAHRSLGIYLNATRASVGLDVTGIADI